MPVIFPVQRSSNVDDRGPRRYGFRGSMGVTRRLRGSIVRRTTRSAVWPRRRTMARTALFHRLQHLVGEVAAEAQPRPPRSRLTRRRLLQASAAIGVGAATAAVAGRAVAASGPRVVII